jgi:hypothetical protein
MEKDLCRVLVGGAERLRRELQRERMVTLRARWEK